MWPDRVSNPGPLTLESGAPLTALRGPAQSLAIFGQANTYYNCQNNRGKHFKKDHFSQRVMKEKSTPEQNKSFT